MILNEDRFCHSRPLLLELKVLSVYQINLYQHLTFMRRRKINDISELFDEMIKKKKINIQIIYPISITVSRNIL